MTMRVCVLSIIGSCGVSVLIGLNHLLMNSSRSFSPRNWTRMSTGPKSRKTSFLESFIFISSSKTLLKEPTLQDNVIYAFMVGQESKYAVLDKFNLVLFCSVMSIRLIKMGES